MSSSAQPLSALDQNRHLAHRWFEEVWNQGRREVIAELFAPECVLHDGSVHIHGPREFEAFYDNLNAQFKDVHITPTPGISLSEGDLVSLRWHVDCTHRDSGKTLSFSGMSICRIKDGRFVEAWQNWDAAGMQAQLNA